MKISRTLLEAISFSARAHRGQVRKDRETPYHAHPVRVATVLMGWGVDDEPTLVAAFLHDTLEDTSTDWDDLAAKFGTETARLVALLTKDNRLPEAERESTYFETLAAADWRARVVKLADSYDNLLDLKFATLPTKALAKAEKVLARLAHGDEPQLAAARAALADLIDELRLT